MAMLSCCAPNVTTYRHSFGTDPKRKGVFAMLVKKAPQTDETLISGHYTNNLQVDGKQLNSRVWPKQEFGIEEYKDFLKRLECCKKELHKLYFRCPGVRIDYIEQMLQDLEKSTYQRNYSPDVYVSLKAAKRMAETSQEPTNMKYYETTYRVYYNRIEELYRFKHLLLNSLPKHDKARLARELRKIGLTGWSTYQLEICVPAAYGAKKTLPTPIDRYTLRRL